MSSTIFALDIGEKTLTPLERKSMTDLGLSEPQDLESWLASVGDGLFGRKVIWIARQHRPSTEQRSDLIGVDELGNLLVTELKSGLLAEDAITQAFGYAAEYAGKSAADLAALFASQSEKGDATGLVSKAGSIEDAEVRLSAHVGQDTEINESQVILLVGEDFAPKALAVCDYLNRSTGEASFSIECWRYSIFSTATGGHQFLLEQVIPAPSVRQEIEEKREASKKKKYARDPVRVEFMRELLEYLKEHSEVAAWRSRGQSYECRIKANNWAGDHDLWFSLYGSYPRLLVPPDLDAEGSAGDNIVAGTDRDGRCTLTFSDIDVRSAKFLPAFGDRLAKAVRGLKVAAGKAGPAPAPGPDGQGAGAAA